MSRATAMCGLTLHAALDQVAAEHQETTISFPGSADELSLAALSTGSQRVASSLREMGIGAGHRVGALCVNEPDFLLLLFGLSRVGASLSPLPLPMLSRAGYPARVRNLLSSAGIKDV